MRIIRHNRWASGFTILELMVAIAIAMVVLGVAVPSFLTWLPTLRLSSGQRQVATDLQVARMKAIAQNTKFRIDFVTTSTYQVERDSNGNGTYDLPSEIESGPFTLPDGITVTATGATWEFSPRGTAASNNANGSTKGSIVLQNVNGDTKTVQISTVGRVVLQ